MTPLKRETLKCMILDDPMPDEPLTDEQRQKLSAWFDKTFADRIGSGEGMILLMPPMRVRDDTQ